MDNNRKWYLTKFIVKLFYFISFTYTTVNLGGPFYEIPGTVFLVLFTLTIIILFVGTLKVSVGQNTQITLFLLTPLLLLNGLMSIEVFNSMIYWTLWIMFILGVIKVVKNINQEHIEYILKHIPYMLLLASVTLFIILFPYLEYSLPTKNSLGLLAGGSLIASISINKLKYKLPSALISLIILILSDSRSSLVFAVGITILYLIMSINRKTLPIFTLIFFSFLGSYSFLYDWFEQKILKKEIYATNLQEAILAAQKERSDLLSIGWELFKERPLIGFGLKSKYYEGRIKVSQTKDIHVHNGYLGTLIETGLLISFFVLLYILIVLRRITWAILTLPRRYNKVWAFFLLFGLIRAYGENYLVFNIGNIFSILFLFLSITLVFNKKIYLFEDNGKLQNS